MAGFPASTWPPGWLWMSTCRLAIGSSATPFFSKCSRFDSNGLFMKRGHCAETMVLLMILPVDWDWMLQRFWVLSVRSRYGPKICSAIVLGEVEQRTKRERLQQRKTKEERLLDERENPNEDGEGEDMEI
eukprot:CAMPEP_0206433794 /NCGR_PEP_ID=MMETSP0324_2-20121206/8735_1 /ASSEMBLY_ACC=CAM_ASM_000836 /TAXON_ID=2866 /ORGANISM="Crypthecodinium cohnii, Strain Seligo" /LENGTH=129 /DNA_ID=CAMNT_0053900107 /DNA_START=728 /DNA_END=1117 /DNA_ORIENTATION=+